MDKKQYSDKNLSYMKYNDDDIVISGMAGKFPNSYNIYHFRDNLFDKVDLVSDDTRRWKPIHPEVPQRTGKMFDIEKFDAGCFGVTNRQCAQMDPSLRMLLELSVEAMLDAGYNPSDFVNSNTGVLASACFSETEKFAFYEQQNHCSDPITGSQRSMLAKRISHALQLKGPAMIVDTACSSSLFGLEHGYSLIKSGRCSRVLVSGSNLCLHPIVSLQFARLGVLSTDGSCKSFDEAGNGYARSEGIVVCLLEKSKEAKRIYSKIIHIKTNCDGYKKEGITFPSSNIQKLLLKDFYEECKVDPTSLTFMEAHGTGTKVGDPEELRTLDEIFCIGRDRPLHIGAVKSNIGHNEPASGLCSVVKTVLAMETGFIPPNIHYNSPRKGVEPLETGKMVVVNEKCRLPDNRGLFGVNSFGFGGANGHVLLYWNTKTKINNGHPNDNLPRLICIGSRTQQGIDTILDDYKTRNLDAEYAYLIHQVFRKPLINNLYRGFGIYNKQDEIIRSSSKIANINYKLSFVFSNFEKEWLKLGHGLLEVPVFAKIIKSVNDILMEIANINIFEILKNSIQNDSISHILGTIAVQIAIGHVLKEIKLLPYKIVGLGNGKFAADYFNNHVTLKETILSVFNKISLSKTKTKDLKIIKNLMPVNGNGYQNGVHTEEVKINQNSVKYVNGVKDVNNTFDERNVINLIIGDSSQNSSRNSIMLINTKSKDYVVDFLSNLGSLYELGFDMELDKLYPKIALPVSRGTPMLSPLIKWSHNKSMTVHLYKNEGEIKSGHRVMHVVPKTEDWSFIVGHVIDGRNLFPATGYLILVWETLAVMKGKLLSEMKVIFEDVKYIRATHVHQDGSLELIVMIQTGTNDFQISEGGNVVVTGKIFEKFNDIINENHVVAFEDEELCLSEKDVYKELKIRGYHYTGMFRNIRKCNVDASRALVEWEGNWIPFIDSLLQLSLVQEDTRNIYVPTSIQYLAIDAPKHINAARDCDNIFFAKLFKELNVARIGGVEMRGLGPSPIPRKKGGDPVLETYKFVANHTTLKIGDSVRAFVELVLENSNTIQAKVVEVLSEDQREADLICPYIQKTLEDIPLMRQEIIVLSNKPVDGANFAVENKPLETESNCLILVLSNVLETTEIPIVLNVIKDAKGFVISREHLKADLSKFDGGPLQVLCSHKTDEELLVLLKPISEVTATPITLDISDTTDEFEWIPKLQNLLKESNKVILYSQNNEISGLLGLINCLRREANGSRLFGVLIMDKAPSFDINLNFYKRQLEKNLAINVWKDGTWGTYRHLLLPDTQIVEREHCYVNVTTKGDLSSLSWLEGNLDRDDPIPIDKDLIHIYYAALNFRDLMTASGKLTPDAITKDRVEQECVQGFEFSGRDSKGRRVMGLCQTGSLASVTTCNKHFLYEIPDGWSMEEAATVPVVYGTVLQVLAGDTLPKVGQSILIHSGTGGIGLAAINLSLYFGLNIFVTVGTEEKRNFIKTHYPQIREEQIGNSRDLSFELMVHKYTNGRGVDYVLNSLAEEKLLASVRCLANGGKFMEIGKFDLANNNPIALHLLEKGAQFFGLAIDKFLAESNLHIQQGYSKMIKNLLRCGAIKPLPRTIFEDNEIEQAFRYMGTGKHIGKILIKVRNEEDTKVYPVPRRLFKGLARFYCNPNSSYILLGGLGGFGLELADWLVVRGAKKLVLTSKSGLSNGYQKYRIKIWEGYGAVVITSTLDASTEEGCTELIKLANNLGPVDGIFNLAAVLKDALFENQTIESFNISCAPKAKSTKYLDSISRKLCPNLRYFVIFSSTSCGRGNTGQSNYGMANSIMERICEKRKRQGYPAVAIQWGAIGEVGLVAKMQEDHKELVIGGTLQQRISSCLQVLDQLLRQDDPVVASMLVAEKKYGGSGNNMFDAVLNILGVNNLKAISIHSTFPELGMDSMMAVEIKQTLEREFEVFLTAQDIRGMTLAKLKDISNAQEYTSTDITTVQQDLPVDIKLLLHYIGSEEYANIPVVKMKTLVEENQAAPQILALPGLEGTAVILEKLCENLKAHVSCVQFCNQSQEKTIQDIAMTVLPCVQSMKGEVIILAYSYGTVVTVELLRLLESAGRKCKVIFLDGSPDLMQQLAKSHFPVDNEDMLQVMLLCTLMMRYMSYDYVLKHQQTLLTYKTFEEKIDYLISISPKVDVTKKYITEMSISAYNRIRALLNYKGKAGKLKSTATLLRASSAPLVAIPNDYNLSTLFDNQVDVFIIEGNHVTMLENNDLADHINKIIE